MKPNNRQQMDQTLTKVDLSLYGNGPQNNQHQDQTKLRLHNFLYNWAQLNLGKKQKLRYWFSWILRIKIVPGNIWQLLYIT